jgi:Zn-dependent protease
MHDGEEYIFEAEFVPSRHANVLAEIVALRDQKQGWGTGLTALIVSLLLFVGLGAAAWDWKFVLLLIPILLFHEMGHLLAMRWCNYRNLRMFFIPLLGAAVSGQNYNVPGWKKVIVSLMGPLPGIAFGIVIGLVAASFEQPLLLEAAILMLFLNGFNLLPLLPLDGGWVMHAIIFSRHYLLDVGFRFAAASLLLGGGLAIGDWFLTIIGVFMLMGITTSYRVARIVGVLRGEGFTSASDDNESIPINVAERILDELVLAFPTGLNDRLLAKFAGNVFEALNARPPNAVASVLFLALHLASFLTALVFAFVFIAIKGQAIPG